MRSKILFAVCFALLSACSPRGETRTLEQVLDAAKARYQEVKTDGVSADVQKELTEISSTLDAAVNNPDATQMQSLSARLDSLIVKAGPTSRPALNEIVGQYRELGARALVTSEQAKLIVSRTYHVLASELETNQFRM